MSYTSVASARQAAHKEHGRLIGSEQSDVEQRAGGRIGPDQVRTRSLRDRAVAKVDARIQLQSNVSGNEKNRLFEIRQGPASSKPGHPLELSEDVADLLLETTYPDFEVTKPQAGHKRSMSDPGRDTPVIPEAEAILSDDSKSETALADTLQRDSPACSAASVEQEVQIYPTIRSVSRYQEPASGHWVSPAHTQGFETEEMARRLSEANERLAQWHAWAAQNGIPVPPNVTLPIMSDWSQSNGNEVSHAFG